MFRKKAFAVMATVLFVGSTMSMAPAFDENKTDCLELAMAVSPAMAVLFNLTWEQELEFFDNFFVQCYHSSLNQD
jgi:hypothetical protein